MEEATRIRFESAAGQHHAVMRRSSEFARSGVKPNGCGFCRTPLIAPTSVNLQAVQTYCSMAAFPIVLSKKRPGNTKPDLVLGSVHPSHGRALG